MSTDDKNDGTNTGSEDEALPDFIETEDDDATVADAPEVEAAPAEEAEAAPAEEAEAAPAEETAVEEAPAAPAPPRSKGKSKDEGEPVVWISPHAEGIFEGHPVDEKEIANWEPEAPYGGTGHNKIALMVMTVAVVGILGHLLLIGASESRSQELQAFVDGNIVEYKTAEVLRLKKQWRDEDRRARNIYGDVTLTYFPADSTVKVSQVTYFQEGESWRKELADRKEVGRKDMPNETAKLTEGQTIERLPLLNLPIFEAEKGENGSVNKVYSYEYELEFTREGYHPQKKTWRQDNWQRIGPGNRIIDWSGLDLVPKPETIKENFANAMGDIHCLMKLHELPTLQAASSHENFEMLLMRNRIKTSADFQAAQEVLTRGEHAEWWKTKQEEIAKRDCGPAAEKK
ncbi:MAG: hypothetical protein ACPGU1_02195 [Myxococcota bacterium]